MTHPAAQRPTLSRLVHFVLPDGQHRSATVINENPERPEYPTLEVALDPFTDHLTLDQLGEDAQFSGSGFVIRNAQPDPTGSERLSWHWPERV